MTSGYRLRLCFNSEFKIFGTSTLYVRQKYDFQSGLTDTRLLQSHQTEISRQGVFGSMKLTDAKTLKCSRNSGVTLFHLQANRNNRIASFKVRINRENSVFPMHRIRDYGQEIDI